MDVSGVSNTTSRQTAAARRSRQFRHLPQAADRAPQNQDPRWSRWTPARFTRQLVQYSSVERGIQHQQEPRKTLIGIREDRRPPARLLYLRPHRDPLRSGGALANGERRPGPRRRARHENVTLTVKNADGKTIYTGTGPKTAGANPSSGTAAPTRAAPRRTVPHIAQSRHRLGGRRTHRRSPSAAASPGPKRWTATSCSP